MTAFRCLWRLMILIAGLASSTAAELKPLLDPNDLPPYPTVGSPTVLTHSQQERGARIGGRNESQAASANAEEQALVKEIDELEKQVEAAEAKAYRDDPALLLSDSYQEKAHEWVMDKHSAEFNASLNFSRNLQKEGLVRLSKVVSLIDMILFIELAGDPKFLPIFSSVYGVVDEMAKTNKAAFGRFYNCDRNDKLIGYAPDSAAPSITSLKEYLVELNKRYPLLLSKLEEMKKEEAIPEEVIAGLKFGDLYRMLDGLAQMAVEVRTPKEVKELRQKLRTKEIELANLRAKRN